MKLHNPELISALVDGELHGLRRWAVERHLKRCALCAAEYRHMQHVREMLAANPVQPVMSDSTEFFWSKVKRDIQAHQGQTVEIPAPRLSFADWLDQHRYAFAGATTALVAVLSALLFINADRPTGGEAKPAANGAPLATVERVETSLPETAASAFQSKDAGVTVIWVSGLPWTKDMKEMQTLFASLDS